MLDTDRGPAAVKLRNLADVILSVIGLTTLAIASVAPGWDVIRLVGLTAMAGVATDLLSRGGGLPR
jgi:hypothetical protein